MALQAIMEPGRRSMSARPCKVLPGRARDEWLDGLKKLALVSDARSPTSSALSDGLEKPVGWRVVAVPSLVPDEVFFDHLANRRFPGRAVHPHAPDQLDESRGAGRLPRRLRACADARPSGFR